MPGKYTPLLRILHWTIGLLIICMLFLGWFMENGVTKDNPARMDLFNLHKSFGVTIFILVVLRIGIRLMSFIPPLPETMHPLIRSAAKVSHYILYIGMVMMPVTGYAMSNGAGYGVKLFGLALPKIFPANKEMSELMRESHQIIGYTLMVLVALHIAAAIKHRFFDKKENDVLQRII